MKTLKYSGSFKKDLKRYKNNSKKIAELEKVLHFLEETGMVPTEYEKPSVFLRNPTSNLSRMPYLFLANCHNE